MVYCSKGQNVRPALYLSKPAGEAVASAGSSKQGRGELPCQPCIFCGGGPVQGASKAFQVAQRMEGTVVAGLLTAEAAFYCSAL